MKLFEEEKITKELLDQIEWLEHNSYQEEMFRKYDLFGDDYTEYVSKDGRLTVTNVSNLSDSAWNFHLDNEDMDSIASFSAEKVEDVNTILGIYKYPYRIKKPELHMVEVDCPMCGTTSHLAMTASEYKDFFSGKKFVQEVFPHWSKTDREMLISGMCPLCQKKIFDLPEE